MTKQTVTRLFVGSAAAIVAGVITLFVAVWIAYANGVFVMNGADVVGVQGSPSAWAIVGLAIVAIVAVIGGSIGGLVSWIGALLNTSQLEDKTWFIVLLVLGLMSFGLVAMIAYVIGGPDGTDQSRGSSLQAPA